MGVMRKFENRMEDSLEGMADRMSNAPINPVKIIKKAEKEMLREKMVGAGKQYAPTLYTVLVNVNDDARLFGYYPTLAGETETHLMAKAESKGLVMDGQPLVRFFADDTLKSGKFDIIAEVVAAPVVEQLRAEEMQRYGIAQAPSPYRQQGYGHAPQGNRNPYGGQENQPYAWHDDAEYGMRDFNDAGWDAHLGQSDRDDAWNAQPASEYSEPMRRDNAWQQEPDFQDGSAFAAASDPVFPNAAPDPVFPGVHEPQPATPLSAPATMVMGAARPTGQATGAQASCAQLVNTATGEIHIARSAHAIIGRGTGCDIMIADLNASRNHAELRHEPQGFWSLTDLNSTNGTIVNGRRIASVPLQEGDQITIGMTKLAFSPR